MSDQSEREREDRAFEALIASQLRRDRDIDDSDDLPELTEAEQAAMDALDPNLVESLWEGGEPERESSNPPIVYGDCESPTAAFAGMNRAEEIDEETKRALDKEREQVLERLRKKKQGKSGKDE
jgi:hypothetical protein